MSSELLLAVAGNAAGAGEATYVEDVFSTYLYTGNNVKNTVNNGIKLSTNRGVGSSVYFLDHHNIINTGTSVQAGTQDFTIEFFYKEDVNTTSYAVFFEIHTTADAQRISIQRYSNENKMIYVENGTIRLTTTDTINAFDGDWHHHAIVRNGNTVTYYLDGTSVGTYTTSFNNNAGDKLIVGTYSKGITAYRIEGFMSNLRYVIGTAVYTSSFTPPTEDLTAISGTEVLLYQGDNLLSDNSSNSYSLTGTSPLAQNGFGPYEVDFETAKGGLVWLKNRDTTFSHTLYDTERGAEEYIISNATNAESTLSTGLTSFNANGFTHGSHMGTDDVVSWTFAKAPKFFDVVTWTGTGGTRNISHNLNTTVGMLVMKATSTTSDWVVYHRGLANAATNGIFLDRSDADYDSGVYRANTAPTDSVFTVDNNMNASGTEYVAYLFAHNDGDGGFGENADQDIIKCSAYIGNSTAGNKITVGFEPQWLLIKNASASADWFLFDVMRGLVVGGSDRYLRPNGSYSEASGAFISVLPDGFQVDTTSGILNDSGSRYIYTAIRRGPMKTPESGTEVFAAEYGLNASAGGQAWSAGFPVDMHLRRNPAGSANYFATRMMGDGRYLITNENFVEASLAYSEKLDNMDGIFTTSAYDYTTWVAYMWKRAPGFFDVVCFDGTGAVTDYNHNLGVVPEMIWVKERTNDVGDWAVWHKEFSGASWVVELNRNAAKFASSTQFNSSTPTSSVFTLGTQNDTNGIGDTYVACLFASVDGVSKVGSYEGNGSSQTIDCGFADGASFVLIKNIDSLGNWYVFDDQRGIVAGNDPYHFLDTSAAHVTTNDSVDPDSSGFIVNNNGTTALNTSGNTYIFLAIA